MQRHPTPGPTRRCRDRSNLARGCHREHWHFFGLPTLRSPETKRTEWCGAEWRPLQNWWDEPEERHALNSRLPARPPLSHTVHLATIHVHVVAVGRHTRRSRCHVERRSRWYSEVREQPQWWGITEQDHQPNTYAGASSHRAGYARQTSGEDHRRPGDRPAGRYPSSGLSKGADAARPTRYSQPKSPMS